MYSKVLLTLDGSDLSREAASHAAEIAQATGAELILMQVIDSEAQMLSQTAGVTIEPVPMGRVSADVAREAVEGQRQAARENLETVRAQVEAAGATNVVMEVREGEPAGTIVEAVEDLRIDLVVMATSGRSGFKRALLGSIADHVVRNTPTAAVLLVRPVGE